MSFLSRLFGSAKPTRDVAAELKRLEAEAESAAPGYVGTAFNRAGDLALRGGESDRALKSYGRAIDAFLQDAQREAARGVANKIIRVRPSAVRTLCTLTWLDLAARHQATALLHLRDYVRAARDAGQHARAATQIFAMGRISADPEFVGAVADALDSLDFPTRAEEVRGWAGEGAPGAISDPTELGQACLDAAVRSNDKDQLLLVDVDPVDSDAGGEAGEAGESGESLAVADESVADEFVEVEEEAVSPVTDDAGTDQDAGEVPRDAWMVGDEAESGDAHPVDADAGDDTDVDEGGADEKSSDDESLDGNASVNEDDGEEAAAAVVTGATAGPGAAATSSGEKKKKGKKSRKGRKNRKKKK